jgi:hypothetical protein
LPYFKGGRLILILSPKSLFNPLLKGFIFSHGRLQREKMKIDFRLEMEPVLEGAGIPGEENVEKTTFEDHAFHSPVGRLIRADFL